MIEIDAFDGGQVFRNSIGLSSLLKKDVLVKNIRANRKTPGLQKQHLAGLKFLSLACSAKTNNPKIGFKTVSFSPKNFSGGSFSIKIGSAGSSCLVAQSIMLPSMLKETKIRIVGGTDVPFAPPAGFLHHVLFPVLRKNGCHFDLSVVKRGYYPKGNGSVVFSSKPVKKLEAFSLSKRKEVLGIDIFCHSSGLPKDVSKTMALVAQKKLFELGKEVNVFFDVFESKNSVGCGLEIFGRTQSCSFSGSALGKKGMPSEKVALLAVENFLKEFDSNAAVDVHTSDQLVPFMALANGKSSFSCRTFSHHLQKSIEVVENFTGTKFEMQEKNGLFFVSVNGINFFGKDL